MGYINVVMFHPVGASNGRRHRTQYMLAPGGRVVRAEHDPSVGDKFMVPTESELKTILYDQVRQSGLYHRINNKYSRRGSRYTTDFVFHTRT